MLKFLLNYHLLLEPYSNFIISIMMESIFLTLVCLIPLMGHPITLGFLILRISSLGRVLLCKFVASWFGYRLFLVYVGGILVIFSYVVSLSPNLRGVDLNFFVLMGVSFLLTSSILVYFLPLEPYNSRLV